MRTRTIAAWLLISLPLCAAEDGWRMHIHEAHEGSIDAAHERVKQSLDGMPADAYGRNEIPDVRHLMDLPTRKASVDALLGNWRCRSIQIGKLGVFSYPPFRCEIILTEDGTLEFTKTTGSQRRHGQVYPYLDDTWVFLGGSSVNDEPYRIYSANNPDFDGEDVEGDSVGLLETLEGGRMRLILDATETDAEIYELKR